MEKIIKITSIALSAVIVILAGVVIVLGIQLAKGEQPSLFGYSFYHVLSASMEPTISTNANIVVKEIDTDTLEVGDIISFESKDEAIYGMANTHRIIAITEDEDGNTCYITKGDGNAIADELFVYPEDVYGKVVYYTTAIYVITMFFSFVQTGTGFVMVVVIPLCYIAYLYVKDFTRSVNEFIKAEALKELEEKKEESDEEKRGEHTEKTTT